MIKFFRKLRFSSLSRKRFPKYLLYATGEIVLVVIGILIALYLNNQQQEYTIHKQQENYLRQIRGEMVNNLNSLKVEKEELSLKIQNAYSVLTIANSDSLKERLTEAEMSRLVLNFQQSDIVLFYENGALNQIIYSGGLKDIKNDSISSSLASWEGKISRVRKQEDQVAEAQGNLESYFYKNGDFRSLADDLGYSEEAGFGFSTNVITSFY